MTTQIFTGDCLTEMQRIAASSVDMVLADLPYGQTQNAWDKVIDMPAMWAGLHRVSKPNAAIVLMAAQPFAAKLICSNLSDFRYDLIWRKNKPTGFANANRQPLRNHEHILMFYRAAPPYFPQKTQGHKPANTARRSKMGENYGAMVSVPYGGNTDRHPVSVQDFAIVNNDDPAKVHPTQKPVELMEWLIRSYSLPGDTVLDFTMGSGTTGVAAHLQGRKFIGIEASPEYAAVASSRINAAVPMLAAG